MLATSCRPVARGARRKIRQMKAAERDERVARREAPLCARYIRVCDSMTRGTTCVSSHFFGGGATTLRIFPGT